MPNPKKSAPVRKSNTSATKVKQPSKLNQFFSKKRNILIVGFVMIFAVIGSYMAFSSHALDCLSKPGYCRVSPSDCGNFTLTQGSSGACVKVLQQSLNYYMSRNVDANGNFYQGPYLTVDGNFGPQTRTWVIFYQQRNHQTVDGIVGPQTWQNIRGNCWAAAGACDALIN